MLSKTLTLTTKLTVTTFLENQRTNSLPIMNHFVGVIIKFVSLNEIENVPETTIVPVIIMLIVNEIASYRFRRA